MANQTDSVIIIAQAALGTATDASVVVDPTGAYPNGIQAERIVLRSNSDRSGVLDLLLRNGSYVVPTYDDGLRRQMENSEVLLTEIGDLIQSLSNQLVVNSTTVTTAGTGVLTKTITSSDVLLTTDEVRQNDTIIISGTLTANVNLIIPSGNPRNLQIINLCQTTAANLFNVTVKTNAGGGPITAPLPALVSTDETAIQTSYTAILTCDGTNVYDEKSWSIRGSNARGSYSRNGNGLLNIAFAGVAILDGALQNFPFNFSAIPIPMVCGVDATGSDRLVTLRTVSTTQYNIKYSGGGTHDFNIYAIGPWR